MSIDVKPIVKWLKINKKQNLKTKINKINNKQKQTKSKTIKQGLYSFCWEKSSNILLKWNEKVLQHKKF